MKLTLEEFFKREYCGAKTRAGTPCKRKDLYDNGRCRLHGGLSTGPKTKAGKKRSARNGFKKKGIGKNKRAVKFAPDVDLFLTPSPIFGKVEAP